MKKKIMDVITGIVFLLFLILASGLDHMTTGLVIAILACLAWIGLVGYATWRGGNHGNSNR